MQELVFVDPQVDEHLIGAPAIVNSEKTDPVVALGRRVAEQPGDGVLMVGAEEPRLVRNLLD